MKNTSGQSGARLIYDELTTAVTIHSILVGLSTATGDVKRQRGFANTIWFKKRRSTYAEPAAARYFSRLHNIQTGSCSEGTADSFLEGLWPACELLTHFHLVPRLRIRGTTDQTSTPSHVFMAWCLIRHRDNSTFAKCTVERGAIGW
jgi:hypothetical protein